MKPVITFVRIAEGMFSSDNLVACMAICRDARLKHLTVLNTVAVLKKGKGNINPSGGFIMETNTGEILFNWHQLAKWIDKQGLIPL